jgi:hypothetical protein
MTFTLIVLSVIYFMVSSLSYFLKYFILYFLFYFPHTPPKQDYSQILATSLKIEDGLHLGACEYGS